MTKKKIFMFLLLGLCLGSVMGQQPHVAIGDILCSDGSTVRRENWTGSKTAIGVVFYVHKVDNEWHGWALHLKESSGSDTKYWASSGYGDIEINTPIPVKKDAVSDMDGAGNTSKAFVAISNILKYPAYSYANIMRQEDGNEWYLPALGQLHYLYAQLIEVNLTLEMLGKTQITGSFSYWSSTEYDAKNAWYLNYDGSCGNYAAKTARKSVRAVMDF